LFFVNVNQDLVRLWARCGCDCLTGKRYLWVLAARDPADAFRDDVCVRMLLTSNVARGCAAIWLIGGR
jgi:hypothetical protein